MNLVEVTIINLFFSLCANFIDIIAISKDNRFVSKQTHLFQDGSKDSQQ